MDARQRVLLLLILCLSAAADGCYWWATPAEQVPLDAAFPPPNPGPLGPDGTATDRPYGEVYVVGPEDVLDIDVADHPEFSGKVTVDRTGKFDMPLLANSHGVRIHAEGLDLAQVADTVREAISPYVLDDPPVVVDLAESNSKHYFVLGYVQRQGRYSMGDREVRLREALMRANLFRDGANHERVHIITPDATHPTYVAVDGWDILTGMTLHNIALKPGDIVFVPPTAWQMTAEVLDEFVERTGKVRSADQNYDFWDTEQLADGNE